MMALARKIVSGEKDEAETVEEVFAQARDAESEAEELLVDADWRPVEVEPETSRSTYGHGANGNGHQDGLGPTVELIAVNGHNGNAHQTTRPTSRSRSLFSWAEFMAAEPKGLRSRRTQASARLHVHFRVGFRTGAGAQGRGRAGRSGTIERNTRVRMPHGGILTRPIAAYAALFAFPDRRGKP